METYLTPSNITFALGLLAIIFTVYNYFKNPQIKSDKTDALMDQRLKWNTESSDKRFAEIQKNFEDLLLQSNNHIHTVEIKVDTVTMNMNIMSNEITKLSTIIEERIPRK